MKNKINFWVNELEVGYYEKILSEGLLKKSGIQSNWHNLTFLRVKKYLKKGIQHLDYACGPGSLIGLYSESISVGYDIAYEQISYANRKFKTNEKCFTSNKVDILKNDYYDVITINGLFEYLNNEEILNLLNVFHKILKENGKILITTPNYSGIFKFIEILGQIISGVKYSNVNINKFTKKRAISLIKKSEYKKYQVMKFMNIGVFFSFISHDLGNKVEKSIEKLFRNSIGMLLFIEIQK